jgi:hypothetical protein
MSSSLTTSDNELSEPLIKISLAYYLQLACKGIENVAIISKKFGEYLTLADPSELYYHVEPIEDSGDLVKLYPIKEWKDSVKRAQRQKEASEASRQIRYALEQEQAKLKSKLQRRRDILQEMIVDVKKLFPGITQKLAYKYGITNWKQQEEWLEYTVFRALTGEHPKAAEKFKISLELIEEFKLLPRDPDFKNRYFLGTPSKGDLE